MMVVISDQQDLAMGSGCHGEELALRSTKPYVPIRPAVPRLSWGAVGRSDTLCWVQPKLHMIQFTLGSDRVDRVRELVVVVRPGYLSKKQKTEY